MDVAYAVRLVSFNPFRALGLPGVTYLKPEWFFREQAVVRAADWVLFPETWQVNTLVYSMRKRIFPAIAGYHLGFNKIEMTRAFQALAPEHLPETLILPNTAEARATALDTLGLPLVLKEPRNSMGRGVFLIESAAELARQAAGQDTLYVQEYLPIQRDLRVVWLGDSILTAYWREGGDGFHHNLARGAEAVFTGIPGQALALVRQVAQSLGLDHAGFDLAEVNGRFYLLEFNLLFGNAALNARGIRTAPLILDYLRRMSAPPESPPLQRAG